MRIEWDQSLETGDREIDIHHQAFFIKAQALVDACRSGRGADVVEEMLGFFTDYAQHHFRAEKQRMEAVEYPYAGTHEAQHDELIARLDQIKRRLLSKGVSSALADDVRELVMRWLLDHIKGSDMPLVELLREKSAVEAPAGGRR